MLLRYLLPILAITFLIEVLVSFYYSQKTVTYNQDYHSHQSTIDSIRDQIQFLNSQFISLSSRNKILEYSQKKSFVPINDKL